MRVLVCGSRTWTDAVVIRSTLEPFAPDAIVMHGAARGADHIAGVVARDLGMRVEEFPADWRGKGRRAGILRNLAMLDREPDLVIAFWDGRSTGTKHMLDEANRRGLPLAVVRVT